MKPTTDGRWAHLACAIWIPGWILSVFVLFFFYLDVVPYLLTGLRCYRNMLI